MKIRSRCALKLKQLANKIRNIQKFIKWNQSFIKLQVNFLMQIWDSYMLNMPQIFKILDVEFAQGFSSLKRLQNFQEFSLANEETLYLLPGAGPDSSDTRKALFGIKCNSKPMKDQRQMKKTLQIRLSTKSQTYDYQKQTILPFTIHSSQLSVSSIFRLKHKSEPSFIQNMGVLRKYELEIKKSIIFNCILMAQRKQYYK